MRCIENNIDAAMADAETAGEESEAEERQLHYDMSQQWRSLWRAGNTLKLLPPVGIARLDFGTNNHGVLPDTSLRRIWTAEPRSRCDMRQHSRSFRSPWKRRAEIILVLRQPA